MVKVILVEDDPMVREINKKFLEKLSSFDVVSEVSSIEDAKEVVSNIEADLILLDVFLPDGKGIDLLKWIRNNEIYIDAIFITADKGRVSVEEAFQYGAVDYLIKPFKFDRFKEALLKYKDRVHAFKDLTQVNQESIDEFILEKMVSSKEESNKIEYIKGINVNTYNKIIEFMEVDKSYTAEEIAVGSGLARVTARRYLEKMAEFNKVDIVQEYGRIGRPTNFYKIK